MNIRDKFKTKVEQLQLTSPCYLDKTMNQLGNLSKEHRDLIKEQIIWFLRIKDTNKAQIKFNAIVGTLNDYQLQYD